MKKLKLQVQMTIDGYIAGPNGELDWMFIKPDPGASLNPVIELADSCDTILLGSGMLPVFTEYWENVVDNQPDSPEYQLARRMVDLHKIVFSRTRSDFKARNLSVENGDLVEAVNKLKKQPGKDLLVYGGARFLTSLIKANLIDEYYIYLNPVAIGKGLSIFDQQTILTLESATRVGGEILLKYIPAAI